MMKLTEALPEIREADAPAEIAAIYDDIRRCAALPQVNLIFRHLATRPPILEWVWQSLRPIYLSENLAEAATGLSRSVPVVAPSPLPDWLDATERMACRTVLGAYNSGNPQNLIALTAFVQALDGPDQTAAGALTPRTGATDQSVTRATAFPPIPRRDRLSPETAQTLDRLASRHRVVAGVIPSLYVHLALWPQVLEPVDVFLADCFETCDWTTAVDDVIASATATARDLAPNLALSPPPGIEETERQAMAGTIRTFINATIPEMVIVGRWLAWDDAAG
jgi:hypothetical protein